MKSLTILRTCIVSGSKEFPWVSKINLFIKNLLSGESHSFASEESCWYFDKPLSVNTVEILYQFWSTGWTSFYLLNSVAIHHNFQKLFFSVTLLMWFINWSFLRTQYKVIWYFFKLVAWSLAANNIT